MSNENHQIDYHMVCHMIDDFFMTPNLKKRVNCAVVPLMGNALED